MNKKNLAIVFGITSNLTFALANVILGLKKYSPTLADEIIIYHDEINEQDQKILSSILPCRFIQYEFPIQDTSKFNQEYFNRFSKLAYARYECFNLLNEFKKVIWLDVDILIQKDISGLLDYADRGFGILAPLSDGSKLSGQLFSPVEEYDMDGKAYSSGTLILGDHLENYNKMASWCYEKTLQYSEYLLLPDQAILNFLIQEFEINLQEIDLETYCCHPRSKNPKDAIILHSYSSQKFWNFWDIKEWDENYQKWLNFGGTPTRIKKANIISKMVNAKWPDSPDPIRKPRQFFLFMLKKSPN